jgi:hypothetical protein
LTNVKIGKALQCGRIVINNRQDWDKKAAGLGLKWGKSGGVTEGEIGVYAVVSLYIPIGYKRFSMDGSPTFILSPCLTIGYGNFVGPV